MNKNLLSGIKKPPRGGEEEIQMDKERLLSVCIITYNQEKYIEQAIESILMQKTDFTFQIIISDDCSTDETPDIIKKYSEKYPDKIKAFFQEKNLGPEKNYLFCFSQAKTKYVVINDGDDYFLSPDKLQKQVDFLENNPEYTICFHPVKKIYEDTGKTEYFPTFKMIRKGLNFNTLLNKNYIQTNSAMYRWLFNKENIKDYLPEDLLPGDWYIHLLHAKAGKIKMLKDVMSVYRVNSQGIWFNQRMLKYGIKIIKFYVSVWENLTGKNIEYFNKRLLPAFKNIIDNYYETGNIEKQAEIKNTYPDIYSKAIILPSLREKKLMRKYRSIIAVLVVLLILSLILFI